MGRRRRLIRSKRVVEVILRVKTGLPFTALVAMQLLIESALARAQRDKKVILCHYLWMGNHVHMLLVSLCPEGTVNFYQELQKKLADSLKRLLGRHRLSMWEGDPVVAEVLDVEGAIGRIAYLYANPARADLVDTVSAYPGVSTWSVFENAPNSVEAISSKSAPWIRLPTIRPLSSRSLSERQDAALAARFRAGATRSHALEVHPNAWMKVFKIKGAERIEEINQRIRKLIEVNEQTARELRACSGKKLVGPEQLRRQEIFRPHEPKKRERRIFVIASDVEERMAYIEHHDRISKQCRELYLRMRQGDYSGAWPPGTFRPPLGVIACALE